MLDAVKIPDRSMFNVQRSTLSSALTLEVALYILLVSVAAGMRLYALGRLPLQPAESAQALTIYHFVQGTPEAVAGTSPLLFHGSLLAFLVLGANDLTARLMPALAGVALVWLAWFLRPWLGRGGALTTAALFAGSSTMLFFSRTLDSALVTAAAVTALLAAVLRYLATPDARHLVWVAVTLALALTAGPATYTFLLAGLVLVIATLGLGRGSGVGRIVNLPYWAPLSDRAVRLRAGAAGAGVFLVVSTGFLLNFDGFQATLDQFGIWVGQWGGPATGYGWAYYLQSLALYDPLILVYGLVGAFVLIRRGNIFAVFLTWWFVLALILYTLAPAKTPGSLVAILLPVTFLAGMAITELWERVSAEGGLDREGLYLAFALPVAASFLLRFATYLANNQPIALTEALVVFLFLVVATVAFFWWERGTAIRGLGLLGLLLLSLVTLHNGVEASYLSSDEPRETLIATSTSPQVREAVQLLEDVSRERERDPHSIAILVQNELKPGLAWYLREFKNVTYTSTPGPAPKTPAILTTAPKDVTPLGGYVGQRFRLLSTWNPADLSVANLARWYFFRSPVGALQTTDFILYLSR